MTLQWIRQARVLLGTDNNKAIQIKDLRMVFRVEQGIVEKPCTLDLKIYNVDPKIVGKLHAGYWTDLKNSSQVQVFVSYLPGQEEMVFNGHSFQFRHARENSTDTFLQVIAMAEEIAMKRSFPDFTLEKGTTTKGDVVMAILKKLEEDGVPTGTPLPKLSTEPIAASVVIHGDAWSELKKYAMGCGCYPVMENGRVCLIPMSLQGSSPTEAIVINSKTGMVGMPQVTQQGIMVKCLLNPKHKLGRAIKLNNADIQSYLFSTTVADSSIDVGNMRDASGNSTGDKASGAQDQDGIYRILSVTHYGDTRGNDWYTEMICTGQKAAIGTKFPVNTTIPSSPVQEEKQ